MMDACESSDIPSGHVGDARAAPLYVFCDDRNL